jgi:hypothetical protein
LVSITPNRRLWPRPRPPAHVDETFAEVTLDGVAMPPSTAQFGDARTITIGSLSKSVWGGLLTGSARADPQLPHRIVASRGTTDPASPVFEQLVAVHALERLNEILDERRAMIRPRRPVPIEAVDRLPDHGSAPPGSSNATSGVRSRSLPTAPVRVVILAPLTRSGCNAGQVPSYVA